MESLLQQVKFTLTSEGSYKVFLTMKVSYMSIQQMTLLVILRKFPLTSLEKTLYDNFSFHLLE